MFCGLNAKKKKIIAFYLILKIWSVKFSFLLSIYTIQNSLLIHAVDSQSISYCIYLKCFPDDKLLVDPIFADKQLNAIRKT